METGLFVISTLAYAAVYFCIKRVARWVLKQDKDALRPRVIGLVGVVVSAIALCAWARLNLVDEAVLASLPEFEAGRYVGNVVGAFAVPAAVAVLVVGARIRRARKNQVERLKRPGRPSPQQ